MAIWDFTDCSVRSKVRTSICKYIVRLLWTYKWGERTVIVLFGFIWAGSGLFEVSEHGHWRSPSSDRPQDPAVAILKPAGAWPLGTSKIRDAGPDKQVKKKKEKVLPWRCKRLKSLVSSSDCHSKHRSGASQIYWWKWNTLSSRPVCAKQILSTPDPF